MPRRVRGTVSSNSTVTLAARETNIGRNNFNSDYGVHKTLLLTNGSSTIHTNIKVVLEDSNPTQIILYAVKIPPSVTLLLNEGLNFNNSEYALKLIVQGVGGTPSIHYNLY